MIQLFFSLFFICSLSIQTCSPKPIVPDSNKVTPSVILPGIESIEEILPELEGKNIAGVFNQSSIFLDGTHIADYLINKKVELQKVFTLEHGFRGNNDAGEVVQSNIDSATNLPLISLYGKNKKPKNKDLDGIDIVIFDVQDVGVRFYTYISTLHYILEACAENNVDVIVLDRPNPNAHYVDGPVLNSEFKSFVGMHPVPIVYGMTIGEYAKMIVGEKWINEYEKCKLRVIACENYTHDSLYQLPVKPSPNLPNLRSILLYPSLCLFEATPLSIGRGTNMQFQVIGHPDLTEYSFAFTPKSMVGAKNPKNKDQICYGLSLSHLSAEDLQKEKILNLSYILDIFKVFDDKQNFINRPEFFDKLAGTDELRKDILSGKKEEEIRASWTANLDDFKAIRSQYLLY